MDDPQDFTLKDVLVQLASKAAIAGREDGVAAVVEERLRAAGIPCRRDTIGNLYAEIAPHALAPAQSQSNLGPRPSIMLSAHMDTIGLVVKEVEESGAIRILPVGGVNRRTLLAQEVWVHGRERLFGVVGTTPPHLTTPAERKQIPPWEQFFVDTGWSGKDLADRVRPGDWISFATSPSELMNERVTSPGLDNRAGVAAVLAAGIRLAVSKGSLPLKVVLHFTVQEELGLRGAGAFSAAYFGETAPAAAIVVDVGFGDMPEVRPRDSIGFGKGPALTLGPDIHKEVRRYLAGAAAKKGIPVQDEVMAGSSGTDAWALQVAGAGVPCAVVSIPLRSMHSTVEVVDLGDLQHTTDLLVAACREANPEEVRGWSGGVVARPVE